MMTDLFQSDILVPMGCKEILGFGISFSHHSRAHDVGQNVVVDNINAVKNLNRQSKRSRKQDLFHFHQFMKAMSHPHPSPRISFSMRLLSIFSKAASVGAKSVK